ncbi:MAG: WD40/YVTN/BNR-like repeat-containing protein, partial [Thermoanaerobaculia bacterium]
MRRTLLAVLAAIVLAAPLAAAVDPSLLAGLKARSIGPAAMSGRIASIEASPTNPGIVYVGTATGGVWKSVNGGLTWTPIFDDQPVAAIGAVALDPSNPDAVWVGSGEGNPRNSVSVGNGIYKSLDGGRTWQHLGLEKTERIHRVVVHPNDPKTAWVAAMGQAWGENPERGVFKTLDGGKTWRKVLYVDERTGCADLVVDPSNPNKLFAAMWDYRRWPWSFRSGGP